MGTSRRSILGSCDLFISFPLNNISQRAFCRAPVLRGDKSRTKKKGLDLGDDCFALVCICVLSLQLEDLSEVLAEDGA